MCWRQLTSPQNPPVFLYGHGLVAGCMPAQGDFPFLFLLTYDCMTEFSPKTGHLSLGVFPLCVLFYLPAGCDLGLVCPSPSHTEDKALGNGKTNRTEEPWSLDDHMEMSCPLAQSTHSRLLYVSEIMATFGHCFSLGVGDPLIIAA